MGYSATVPAYERSSQSLDRERELAGQPEGVKPRYGGTLVWGTVNAPTIINPILTEGSISSALLGLIFNALVKTDKEGQIIPDLAQSWEISPDGLTYVFHLRKGVRFHDGIEFTSADVKFTLEAIADEKNRSPFRLVAHIDGAWEIVDKYTVKLVLRLPDPAVLRKLVKEIAPRHLLEHKDLSSVDFNYQPVGTGPFKFKKWDRNSKQIELEANNEYFEGRPYLDNIVVKTYSDNTHLWAGLMRREVDLVQYLNPDDYSVLSADPDFRTYAVPADYSCAIFYNLEDPILSDLKVRQAIAMGIDVASIMRGVPLNGVISRGPFQSRSPVFNPEVQPIPYAPSQAKALLNAHGWQDAHGTGVLEKEGRPLEIRMLVDGRSDYFQRIAMLIRQHLSEIGIKVVVLLYNNEVALTREYLEVNKVQAWLRFFTSYEIDPQVIVGRWRYLDSPADGLWHNNNKELDDLIERVSKTGDVRERIRLFQAIHKIIYEDQIACFLFTPVALYGTAKKLYNTDGFFSLESATYMISHWFVADDPQ